MWKVWLLFDPRRALIGILAFAFFMVMVNHFVQLSTPRYGSWLNSTPWPPAESSSTMTTTR